MSAKGQICTQALQSIVLKPAMLTLLDPPWFLFLVLWFSFHLLPPKTVDIPGPSPSTSVASPLNHGFRHPVLRSSKWLAQEKKKKKHLKNRAFYLGFISSPPHPLFFCIWTCLTPFFLLLSPSLYPSSLDSMILHLSCEYSKLPCPSFELLVLLPRETSALKAAVHSHCYYSPRGLSPKEENHKWVNKVPL